MPKNIIFVSPENNFLYYNDYYKFIKTVIYKKIVSLNNITNKRMLE